MPHAESAPVVVGRSRVVVDRRQSGDASTVALASHRSDPIIHLNIDAYLIADASDRRNVGCEQTSDGDATCTRRTDIVASPNNTSPYTVGYAVDANAACDAHCGKASWRERQRPHGGHSVR